MCRYKFIQFSSAFLAIERFCFGKVFKTKIFPSSFYRNLKLRKDFKKKLRGAFVNWVTMVARFVDVFLSLVGVALTNISAGLFNNLAY